MCLSLFFHTENIAKYLARMLVLLYHRLDADGVKWLTTRRLNARSTPCGPPEPRWQGAGRAAPPGESVARSGSANAASHPRCLCQPLDDPRCLTEGGAR